MSRFNPILANVQRYVSLTPEDEAAFTAIISERKLRKRQFLVQPGFVCTHQSYVLQGAFRAYFVTNEGIDHTIQFALEDWFISDFNSYINQQPASLYVEALEEAVVQQIEYEAVEQLCADRPIFERYFRMVAQRAFAFSQRRILSNLGNTAEERYVEFQAQYPTIVQRVPQYALASYLGMTPEFLSKIRKRLAQKS